jgi:uncharacterized membrane protein YfcA
MAAFFMSLSVMVLPPIALIPVCWVMDAIASAILVRGSWSEADRGVALGLVSGVLFGLPIGLTLTGWLPEDDSRLAALLLIITLASLQLARIRASALSSRPGLVGSGVLVGFATGIASVGGMVAALCVLSQDRPARVMRATLSLCLVLISAFFFLSLVMLGMLDWLAIKRGLAMAIPVATGVFLGQFLFRPRVEKYYKPFCLVLLLGLATASLLHTVGIFHSG